MPITLDITDAQRASIEASGASSIALKDHEGNVIAIMDVADMYEPDKAKEGKMVFGGDPEHPAISFLENYVGNHYVGGKLRGVQIPPHYDHLDLRRTPAEVRQYIHNSGWENVVAFQTRNPLHKAHFELTLRSMQENNAKLLLHPVVGMTKPGDIDHHTRVKCYRQIMPKYEEDSAILSALPLAMRMAGPREAIWHAIIRKNHGATHFVVGRDHAGPGSNSAGEDFYGPYDARDAALEVQDEIGIKMVPFEMMVYTPRDGKYHPDSTVPKGVEVHKLSGTEVRKRLRTGEEIPEWFSFPEVVKTLRWANPPRSKQGFCIFFTGLSGSGKTTVANALQEKLLEVDNRKITMLDGDHVRQMLSSELSFTSEHRNLNIQRIGYVASEVVKPGGAVIACPIAPYAWSRNFARDLVSKNGAFIEVAITTSVETCEKRDRKGLYAKARQGLIKGFTGLDDPYEAPLNPEITIDTATTSISDAVAQICDYMSKEEFISL